MEPGRNWNGIFCGTLSKAWHNSHSSDVASRAGKDFMAGGLGLLLLSPAITTTLDTPITVLPLPRKYPSICRVTYMSGGEGITTATTNASTSTKIGGLRPCYQGE